MIPISKPIDLALLLLRLAMGGLMIYGHGWPKLLRLFGEADIQFLDFMGLGPSISLGLAVFAEVICSLLVMAGCYTRLAVMPLIFTMGVAAFVANAGQPFADMEKALLFLVSFVVIGIAGAGWYSIDARFRNHI